MALGEWEGGRGIKVSLHRKECGYGLAAPRSRVSSCSSVALLILGSFWEQEIHARCISLKGPLGSKTWRHTGPIHFKVGPGRTRNVLGAAISSRFKSTEDIFLSWPEKEAATSIAAMAAAATCSSDVSANRSDGQAGGSCSSSQQGRKEGTKEGRKEAPLLLQPSLNCPTRDSRLAAV